jgi:enoyl-CoA hydratase/carnithine racemase
MEGCHWPLRKANADHWPKLTNLLLTGRPVRARDAEGWLVDYAGPLDQALATAWKVASGADHGLPHRTVEKGGLKGLPTDFRDVPAPDSPAMEAARGAIIECMQKAGALPLSEALEVSAKLAADFLASDTCREGAVGAEYTRTMAV